MNDGSADSVVRHKDRVREELLERRRQLRDAERERAADDLYVRLEACWRQLRSNRLAGYLAFDNEIDVSEFLQTRLRDGEFVALPRVRDDSRMEFVEIAALDDVEVGAFGILEPVGDATRIEVIDVFVVPGVGFDRSGNRIGMGWGYYDRALQRRAACEAASPTFIGVCYDFQLTDGAIPAEEHDVAMDFVVTQTEIVEM